MNLPWGKNRRSGTNPWHQFPLRRMLISRDFWSLFMAVPHFVLCLQEDMYTDIYKKYISYMDDFPLSAISKISTSICLIQVSHPYDLYHHHWRHVYSSSNKQWPVLDTIQKISSSVHILLIAVFHIYCHYYKQWPVGIHTCIYIYIAVFH